MILRIILAKPKLVFNEVRLGAGLDTDWIFGYYISLKSLRRDSWLRHFYRREDIVQCYIKVKFTVEGQILYRYAEHWNDTPVGGTLHPDSNPHEFPLVYRNQRKDIALAGTPMATNAVLPPHRIPIGKEIIAHVKVFSKGKIITRSKWLIRQKPDIEVRHLENEL